MFSEISQLHVMIIPLVMSWCYM